MNTKLIWEQTEGFDAQRGQTVWEAASPYVIDEGGPSLFWRVRRTWGSTHWDEFSDLELMQNEDSPRIWTTLREAKAALQKDHEQAIADIAADPMTTPPKDQPENPAAFPKCLDQWRPICPHCGYMHQDAWEWPFEDIGDSELTRDCMRCEQPFRCERAIEITYSTYALRERTRTQQQPNQST